MELIDKIALVTSGKRIGSAVAIALAKSGAHVAIVYRNSREDAESTAAVIHDAGRKSLLLSADLRKPDDCAAIVERTVESFGRLDVLVNIASVFRQVPFHTLSLDDWNVQLDVDLRAAWLSSRAAAPHMKRVSGGRIINFSDWSARSGRPREAGYLAYHVAKAAVIALTEALALELAEDGILVNAIAPGPIVPPSSTSAEDVISTQQRTPLGRWGGEATVADMVVALAKNDFITGEIVRVDGGRHLL